jgi:hypothetical protein
LGGGLVVGLIAGLVDGPAAGLYVGLVVGPVVGLVGLLRDGLSFGEIETRTLPNEGIHRSARNAVVFGVIFGLVAGPLLGLAVGLVAGPLLGLFAGPAFGLFVGLYAGGEACLKHAVLRLRLIRNGSTPWTYVRFLDHAADRLLLRKVGGGYAFIYRMLLEYFAARYVEPSSGDPPPAKPSSIKDEL